MNSRLWIKAVFVLALCFGGPVAAWAQTSTTTAPRPSCTMRANPGTVQLGGTSNISWSSLYATGGTLTSVGSIGPQGTQGVIPTRTTNYIGTFTGPGGTATCSVTVQIAAGGGGGGVQSPGTVAPPGTVSAPGTISSPDATGAPTPFGTGGSTIPTQSSSQGGLVPCSGVDCQWSHIAAFVQLIINYAVGISIPVAAGMFAYAGILLFSSAVNPKNRNKAKQIFFNVLIGIAIVLTAWLVIQTIFKVILGPAYTNWHTIDPSQNRRTNTTIQQWLGALSAPIPTGGILPGASGGTGLSGSSHDEIYNTLTSNGICVSYSGGGNTCVSDPGRTSLQGLQTSAVTGVLDLKTQCNCDIRITAGTEGGHAAGTYSHGNGYKVDLGFNPQLDSYIQTNGTPLAPRSDGAALYQLGPGLYAKEGTHWDVVYR